MSIYYVSAELSHHGVKGMKWGVRKELDYQASRVRNIANYGWKQGHGKNVYSRIQSVKKDSRRMNAMTTKQRQSLSNAEKYWKNRAEGKGIRESGKRNIIKRGADAYRSKSFGRRAAITALNSMSSGSHPAAAVAGTPLAMLGEELVYNKMFKHF